MVMPRVINDRQHNQTKALGIFLQCNGEAEG